MGCHFIGRRIAAPLLCIALIITGIPAAYGAETLYETKAVETISKGVTYEKSSSVTDAGLLDIHVLKVGLNDPYITINPVESSQDYGLRETVSALLRETNAIAGVNADFFGVNGAYSAGFGPFVKNGRLISVSGETNKNGNEFASFLYTLSDIPFISFIRTDIRFFNDGAENIKVRSINKITDMVYPVIVTSRAMQTTASLDGRFPGLLKIVVRGLEITYISRLGETVTVPDDGYVLVIQQASAEYFGRFFSIGQRAVLQVEPHGVDFDAVKMAIGGGGLILQDGEPFYMGTIVNGNKREPRTAIGINKEKTQLILVQVDGRTHSIGASHEEMIEIMKRSGAYSAMHLDGGGSSTMVIKDPYDRYNVVNQVSDGAERKVINALGIYNSAPLGSPEAIKAIPEKDTIWLGESVKLTIYGLDAYGRRIDLNTDSITFDDPGGSITDGYFQPGRTGKIRFTARYGEMQAKAGINVKAMSELLIKPDVIRLDAGESIKLSFTGIDSDGMPYDIRSNISYEVTPTELGIASGGEFTALTSGAGYLKCSTPQLFAYVPIYIDDTGDYTVTLPDKPRFRDPIRSEPNETLTDPAVTIEDTEDTLTYSARQNGRYAILSMTGANGSLLATEPAQWRWFIQDINSMNPDCIVIETDRNPLNYSKPKEFDLFHAALAAYQEQGKQAFIISKQGLETSTRIKDGIRYINIGAKWKDAETINENYRVFRLYTLGDTFTYTLL